MPAAAVIPAPIAYIKVVAVKKLVVGFLAGSENPHAAWNSSPYHPSVKPSGLHRPGGGSDNLP